MIMCAGGVVNTLEGIACGLWKELVHPPALRIGAPCVDCVDAAS